MEFGKRPSFFAKYLSRFLLFLAFTAVLLGLFSGLFFLYLTRIGSPGDFSYTVEKITYAGGEPEITEITVALPRDVGFAYNTYYFPINQIMDFMGFFLAGDPNTPSFIRRNPGENLKFEISTNAAYINGARHHLAAPSFMRDNIIYVPLDFILNAFNNISMSGDIISVRRSDDDPQPFFRINAVAAILPIDETTPENAIFLAQHASAPMSFIADLSAFERYFNPAQADEFVRLINRDNPLDPGYSPPDLVDLADTRPGRETQRARLYAARAAEAMLIEARANGHTNITITSGYRNYDLQAGIFYDNVAQLVAGGTDMQEAIAQTETWIARPGQSEHQSGLAIDMHSNFSADQAFGSQPDGIWLARNAHRFGFILRYPEGREHITGIQYEPWHFRYVGRVHAARMFALGLTLEEYHEQILR